MLFDHFDVIKWDCKDIGTPRTAEEVFAIRNEGIPAEAVRKGIFTREAYDEYAKNPTDFVFIGAGEETIASLLAKIIAIDPTYKVSPKATVASLTKKLDAIAPIEEVAAPVIEAPVVTTPAEGTDEEVAPIVEDESTIVTEA